MRYAIIQPDAVQPGDIRKFTTAEGKPVYDVVTSVYDNEWVAVSRPYRGLPTIQYVARKGQNITYGRKQSQ